MATAQRSISWEHRASFQNRPHGRPFFYQSWNNLLFMHWRFDPQEVQRRLPAGLTVDIYNDFAWVAIVPFEMNRIRPKGLPPLPWLSYFLELNVRTYVIDEYGTPGVWFYSLQANRQPAVTLGRTLFGLPYWCSEMRSDRTGDGWFDYQCRRLADPMRQDHRYRWRPVGEIAESQVGTFEYFVAERYVLFSARRDGKFSTGRVFHPPYRLQKVDLEACDDGFLRLDHFTPAGLAPEHAVFCSGVDVEVFALAPPG
jgi:uncharacterized protein YqjF (DUF2071 family)